MNKEELKEYKKQWRLNHLEKEKEYIQKNREKIKEYRKKWEQTQYGRAYRLLNNYKLMDKRKGFETTVDFNAQWIVDNIFSKPCAHCGETDWHKLGCNRLDNSKPHTKDNVEPCCFKCNAKLSISEFERDYHGKFMKN